MGPASVIQVALGDDRSCGWEDEGSEYRDSDLRSIHLKVRGSHNWGSENTE